MQIAFGVARLCPQNCVLKDGKIKAQGSHGKLVKEDEYYAKLYKTQEKWYKE